MRSRFVMREFANKPGLGEFFAPTPSPTATNLLHTHAVRKGYPIIYVGETTAFLHAPESEVIYTTAPEGYEREGFWWRLLRKVNGRQDGTKEFSD